tara:strand:+ start:479 stop:1153 length:675 start_codon:yes stop_codon:yes gene_type:complete
LEEIYIKNFFPKTINEKGIFITFEGGEGSGKSTQIKYLSNLLSDQKIEHIITREPGGTDVGEQIRKVLVQGNIKKLDSFSEFLCFAASRREHLKKIIIPALEDNKIVISDRFLDSSIVYQGMVGGLNLETILQVHNNFCYNKFPDLTLILDVDPELGLKRKNINTLIENRFESFENNFHTLVQEKFLELSKIYSKRCRLINANNDKDFIFNEIVEHIKHYFTSH